MDHLETARREEAEVDEEGGGEADGEAEAEAEEAAHEPHPCNHECSGRVGNRMEISHEKWMRGWFLALPRLLLSSSETSNGDEYKRAESQQAPTNGALFIAICEGAENEMRGRGWFWWVVYMGCGRRPAGWGLGKTRRNPTLSASLHAPPNLAPAARHRQSQCRIMDLV